jgi:hypothetical protein
MSAIETISQHEKASALLSLLVVFLPEAQYTADAGKWANAIAKLKDKYGMKHPDFFQDFRFRRAPRGDSYSSEVSNFLAFLQFADATAVHNPGFTTMEFKEGTRERLSARYKDLVEPGELEAIKEMSHEIAAQIIASH